MKLESHYSYDFEPNVKPVIMIPEIETRVCTYISALDDTIRSVRTLVDWIGFDIVNNHQMSASVGGWEAKVEKPLSIVGVNPISNYMFGFMQVARLDNEICVHVASKLEYVAIILFKELDKDRWTLSIRTDGIVTGSFSSVNIPGAISRAFVSLKVSFDDGRLTSSELNDVQTILATVGTTDLVWLSSTRQERKFLSAAEEIELGQLIQTGGTAGDTARDKLVVRNQNLARHEGNRYFKTYGTYLPSLDVEDYHSAGFIGLIRAAEKFDPALGYRFTTYATHWIRQSIGRMIENEGLLIRLPSHMVETVSRVRKHCSAFMQANDRYPTDVELEEKFEFTGSQWSHVRDAMNLRFISFSDNVPGTDIPISDLIADQSQVDSLSSVVDGYRPEAIDKALAELSDIESRILRFRFGLVGSPRSLEQIGREVGLSRERVRQIEQNALVKLRSKAEASLRESELGEFAASDWQGKVGSKPQRNPLTRPDDSLANKGVRVRTVPTSETNSRVVGLELLFNDLLTTLPNREESIRQDAASTDEVHTLIPNDQILSKLVDKSNEEKVNKNLVSNGELCLRCSSPISIKFTLQGQAYVRCRNCGATDFLGDEHRRNSKS
jgi:RNA polymerase sigma factor (sigma-70 family)